MLMKFWFVKAWKGPQQNKIFGHKCFICLQSSLLRSSNEASWNINWTATWQNHQNDLCAHQRLRSAWASAQFDQSSLCAPWVDKDPSFFHVDREDSDQTGQMQKVILLVLSCCGSTVYHCRLVKPIRWVFDDNFLLFSVKTIMLWVLIRIDEYQQLMFLWRSMDNYP